MKLRACAKINRSLSVLGVRPDGFHELRTVFQSLALHDTLEFHPSGDGLAIDCAAPGVPIDDRNLVWKAGRLVWHEAGRDGEPSGRVSLTKRIPAQGGLGGGSADGAAALVGWDRLWDTRLPADRLSELARRLGADVPFFLVGGTALGVERGDHIRPLDDRPPRWVVLVFPAFGVSTPEAFRWWDEDRLAAGGWRPAAASREAPVRPPVEGLTPPAGTVGAVPDATVVNDLEPPVSRRHPELLRIRQQLEQAGAEQAAMSGSGSTMFGLFREQSAADRAAEQVRSCGVASLVTRTVTRDEAKIG